MLIFSWKGVPYPIDVPCSGKTDLCLPHLDGVGQQHLLFPGVLGFGLLPRAQTHSPRPQTSKLKKMLAPDLTVSQYMATHTKSRDVGTG